MARGLTSFYLAFVPTTKTLVGVDAVYSTDVDDRLLRGCCFWDNVKGVKDVCPGTCSTGNTVKVIRYDCVARKKLVSYISAPWRTSLGSGSGIGAPNALETSAPIAKGRRRR